MKEWVNTIAIIILCFLVAGGALALKAINDRELANQAAQAQQVIEWQTFLKNFTALSDYDCRVLWYENAHDPNLPYRPPLAICNVAAP